MHKYVSYRVYPEGSRDRAAKTMKRFKAYRYYVQLAARELWAFVTFKRMPRRLIFETRIVTGYPNRYTSW